MPNFCIASHFNVNSLNIAVVGATVWLCESNVTKRKKTEENIVQIEVTHPIIL